jgi:TrmH family RNA methyltransferase
MISRNKSKFIISLQKKKVRDEEKLYIIEGDKLVREFLSAGIHLKTIIAKPEFISSLPAELITNVGEIEDVSFDDLKRISTLKTPHNAIAIVPMQVKHMDLSAIFKSLSVALDSVQDPGNFGTIIRAAAWFGIKNIICSNDCVDVYNPKVIQSSMGALLHVNIYYYDLKEVLIEARMNNISVFGTFIDGGSIYNNELDKKGIILLGNESKGISEDIIPFVSEKIMIPKFNTAKAGIDSLNVGMAASIIFSEFLRKSGSTPDY